MARIDIPAALAPYANKPLWVIWRREVRGDKATKVPYQARVYQDGEPWDHAKSNDPATWSDAQTALDACERNNCDGIGINIAKSDLACFDIDDCRDPETGKILVFAADLIRRCATYCEVTPSSKGIRIIGRSNGGRIHRKQKILGGNGASIESYRACERYITVTGDPLPSGAEFLADIGPVMDELVGKLDGDSREQSSDEAKEDAKLGVTRRLPPMLESLLDVVGSGSYQSRSELLFAFVIAAMRAGVDENAIVAACLDDSHAGCGIFEHCRENGGDGYVKRQIEHAANKTVEAGGRQIIRVSKGNRHEAWRATQRAMIAKGCQVFVRGSVLVEPLWRWEELKDDGRGFLAMKFVKYNPARLSDQAARHAVDFQRYNVKAGAWLHVNPPDDVIEALLTRGDWDFPSARGIINTPTLRRDGSLLSAPGYDRATGLWYKPPLNLTLPPMADEPTRDDALAALKLLNDLLDEFPFVDDVAQSVAMSGLVTPVLRGAFKVAPLFFIDKPEAGTGASYLVELISCLATGRPTAPLKASSDPKELTKELSAAVFEAKPILNLNNITFDLASPDLAQIVTEGELDIRPFGKNDELRTCDCRAMTIIANGNNVRVVGELVRRTVRCRLDAKMECPEQRPFKHRPVEEVLATRGKYLTAVFTIARAYKFAGEPRIEKALAVAGFEE